MTLNWEKNENFLKTTDTATPGLHNNILKINNCIFDSYSEKKKLIRTDFDYFKKIVNQIIKDKQQFISILEFEFEILDIFIEIELPPGAYELFDINITIKQIPSESKINALNFGIEADTISMKSGLTTSISIHFNSELNKLSGFTNTDYPAGTHKSEKPVMITTTDKVHLKCDCVDGSIVNGVREQILFSFNISAPPGYKTIKEPYTILYKKKTNKVG